MITVKAVVWSSLILHSSHNWVLNPFIAAAHLYSVRVKANSVTGVSCGDTVIGCLVTEYSHKTHSLGSVQTFVHPTKTQTIKKDSLLFISSPALVNVLLSSLIWLHCTVFIKSKLISYPPCLLYEYSSKIFSIFIFISLFVLFLFNVFRGVVHANYKSLLNMKLFCDACLAGVVLSSFTHPHVIPDLDPHSQNIFRLKVAHNLTF